MWLTDTHTAHGEWEWVCLNVIVWVLCRNPLQVDSSALIFLNFQSGAVPVHLLETTWTPAARRCLCIKSPTFTCVFWWPTPKLQRRIFRGLEHKQTSALFKRYSRLWQRVSQHKHYIEEKLVKKVILRTVHNVWDLWLEVCLEVSECQLEWIAVLFNKVSNTVKCTFLICGFIITLHPYIQLHVRSPGSTCFTYVTLLLILTITHTDIILGPWVNCIVVHFFFFAPFTNSWARPGSESFAPSWTWRSVLSQPQPDQHLGQFPLFRSTLTKFILTYNSSFVLERMQLEI